MLDAVAAAAFEDMAEADEVGIEIGLRILDREAHAGLGAEMDDALETALGEEPGHAVAVGEVELFEAEAVMAVEAGEPGLLQSGIVVIVEIVDADDLVAAFEQNPGCLVTDEAGSPRHQNAHDPPRASRGVSSTVYRAACGPGQRGLRSRQPLSCMRTAAARRGRAAEQPTRATIAFAISCRSPQG